MLRDGSGDLMTFVFGLLLGVAFCLFGNIFATVRSVRKCSVVAVFFQDLFCFSVYGFFTFLLCYVRTRGQLRWFVLFGVAAGWLLFYFTLNKPLRHFLIAVCFGIKKIVLAVNRRAVLPIKRKISVLSSQFEKTAKKRIKKIKVFSKKILQKRGKLLYNKKDKKMHIGKRSDGSVRRKIGSG